MKFFVFYTMDYENDHREEYPSLDHATTAVNRIKKQMVDRKGCSGPMVIFGKEMVVAEVSRVTAYELKDK